MIRVSRGTKFELDAVEAKATIFPDKTSQVWKLPAEFLEVLEKEAACTIRWDFENEAELVHLAQLVYLLNCYHLQVLNLEMPYLPYARQDKHPCNERTFALYPFAKLINSMEFNNVTVLDAHSIHAYAIDHLTVKSARNYIREAIELSGANTVVFPDSGAKARYEVEISLDFPNMRLIGASKTRTQENGNIVSASIHGIVKGHKVILVDDICDGGATFIVLADVLLKAGAKAMHLYVTHGIFSKGVDVLRKAGISRIFTHKGEMTQ